MKSRGLLLVATFCSAVYATNLWKNEIDRMRILESLKDASYSEEEIDELEGSQENMTPRFAGFSPFGAATKSSLTSTATGSAAQPEAHAAIATCPGTPTCSGNGQCDLETMKCVCNEPYSGKDCSVNRFLRRRIRFACGPDLPLNAKKVCEKATQDGEAKAYALNVLPACDDACQIIQDINCTMSVRSEACSLARCSPLCMALTAWYCDADPDQLKILVIEHAKSVLSTRYNADIETLETSNPEIIKGPRYWTGLVKRFERAASRSRSNSATSGVLSATGGTTTAGGGAANAAIGAGTTAGVASGTGTLSSGVRGVGSLTGKK